MAGDGGGYGTTAAGGVTAAQGRRRRVAARSLLQGHEAGSGAGRGISTRGPTLETQPAGRQENHSQHSRGARPTRPPATRRVGAVAANAGRAQAEGTPVPVCTCPAEGPPTPQPAHAPRRQAAYGAPQENPVDTSRQGRSEGHAKKGTEGHPLPQVPGSRDDGQGAPSVGACQINHKPHVRPSARRAWPHNYPPPLIRRRRCHVVIYGHDRSTTFHLSSFIQKLS